jgi:hypothetical protein
MEKSGEKPLELIGMEEIVLYVSPSLVDDSSRGSQWSGQTLQPHNDSPIQSQLSVSTIALSPTAESQPFLV